MAHGSGDIGQSSEGRGKHMGAKDKDIDLVYSLLLDDLESLFI
jgi:hypothetical protein